jgi:hypothetical protein
MNMNFLMIILNLALDWHLHISMNLGGWSLITCPKTYDSNNKYAFQNASPSDNVPVGIDLNKQIFEFSEGTDVNLNSKGTDGNLNSKGIDGNLNSKDTFVNLKQHA